jgi:hypothetical protein
LLSCVDTSGRGAAAALRHDGLWACAPGCSSPTGPASGMNSGMDLERAITPISLSQWTTLGCRAAGAAAPEFVGETAL